MRQCDVRGKHKYCCCYDLHSNSCRYNVLALGQQLDDVAESFVSQHLFGCGLTAVDQVMAMFFNGVLRTIKAREPLCCSRL